MWPYPAGGRTETNNEKAGDEWMSNRDEVRAAVVGAGFIGVVHAEAVHRAGN